MYNIMWYYFLKIKINSYQERLRDWPYDARQPTHVVWCQFQDTIKGIQRWERR